MIPDTILPIEEIRERDIDLLVLEELIVNASFREFFIEELGLNNLGDFVGAYHSLRDERGESDLVIRFKGSDDKGFLVLVENKIDASFTLNQPERYKERGVVYVQQSKCSAFHTTLMAPKSYLSSEYGFDSYIPYETLKNWFEKRKDERSLYRAKVLDCAIEKRRRGYVSIRHEEVTSFQHQFYELSESMFPELCFRRPPPDVPKGSGFLYCEPPFLKSRKIQLVHKFFTTRDHNTVDLQFLGRGEFAEKFIESYQNKLLPGMEIEKANKSMAIRYRLKNLSTTLPFETQRDDLIIAIQHAKQLFDWAMQHLD